MRFPDFLIVGAMKAGTTTLYRDLRLNPAIFMPREKEPQTLTEADVLSDAGRRRYASLFSAARADQVCGESSTHYTKRPRFGDVPARAREVIGPDVRIVYTIRDPVARIASHHYHEYSRGSVGPEIDRIVRDDPRFLDYTRYAWQITPWIETFGRDQVKIVILEEYSKLRLEQLSEISEFLGVEPRPDLVDVDAVYNKGDTRPDMARARGPVAWVRRSPLYDHVLRPLLPLKVRDYFRFTYVPPSVPRPDPPPAETVAWIREELAGDLEDLRRILGRDELPWDLGRTVSEQPAS